ncbi:MAG: cholesterol esterase [Micromonosporaceae bacterium]|nr:cholesterol esterase [Micromonosporaceae bacterium]
MKDTQGNLVLGRTRWRRFAAAAIPAGVVAAGLFAGVAAGIVPVSINISGQSFKVSASRLEGDGFAQYPGVEVVEKDKTDPKKGIKPVATSAIRSADLYDLCQSVKVPGTPFVLQIHAGGGGTPAHADNLLISLDKLQGDATFTKIDIGIDASLAEKGGAPGNLGDFAQQADHVTITDLKQEAYRTQAGTFTLKGLDMRINTQGEECFAS